MNMTLSELVGTSLRPADSLCNGELTDLTSDVNTAPPGSLASDAVSTSSTCDGYPTSIICPGLEA